MDGNESPINNEGFDDMFAGYGDCVTDKTDITHFFSINDKWPKTKKPNSFKTKIKIDNFVF